MEYALTILLNIGNPIVKNDLKGLIEDFAQTSFNIVGSCMISKVNEDHFKIYKRHEDVSRTDCAIPHSMEVKVVEKI